MRAAGYQKTAKSITIISRKRYRLVVFAVGIMSNDSLNRHIE
jgi:hypothetical protein